jgi:hypothetical protein
MPTPKTEAKPATKSEKKATLEEFRVAVRYLLTTDYGMPELIADEVLLADEQYLRESHGDGDVSVSDVADELAFKPHKNRAWVKIEDGQLIVDVNDQVKSILDRLAGTGLYGDSPAQVAVSLLCRGIETVLPVLPLAAANKHR